MTRKDQRRIARELLKSITAELMAKLPKIPEEWDGIEIRQWIADTFARERTLDRGRNKHRSRAYHNAVLTNNL